MLSTKKDKMWRDRDGERCNESCKKKVSPLVHSYYKKETLAFYEKFQARKFLAIVFTDIY